MKLYAELPGYRARQAMGDLFVAAWVALWIFIGRFLFNLIGNLADPGRRMESAGSELASNMSRAGGRVDDVPVVGRYLDAPFESLEQLGQTLQNAGQSQQDTVHTLAFWTGIVFAALPILLVLLIWGIRRWAWIKQASAACSLREDPASLRLLAFRAVATRPLTDLRAAADDPAGAYGAGEYERLAALELNQMGLRAKG